MRRHGNSGRRMGRDRNFGNFGGRWTQPIRERRPLYRARDGVFLGVCKGLSRHFDLPVGLLRAIVLLLFFVTGIWPVGLLYLIAAMLMRMEPVVPFGNADEREFYDSYSSSRANALQRMKRTFESLDRRLRRIEDVVTSRDFEWERRMRG